MAAVQHLLAFRARIQRGADFLDRLLREQGVVYGVTTGYGDSVTVAIPPELVAELPHHLFAYHGVGLGRLLDAGETRAVLAARLASLAQGYSGVTVDLLEQLAAFLAHDVLPRIPAEGSVGASGDPSKTMGGRESVMRRRRRGAARLIPERVEIEPFVRRAHQQALEALREV